jgi:hypothetical protein
MNEAFLAAKRFFHCDPDVIFVILPETGKTSTTAVASRNYLGRLHDIDGFLILKYFINLNNSAIRMLPPKSAQECFATNILRRGASAPEVLSLSLQALMWSINNVKGPVIPFLGFHLSV